MKIKKARTKPAPDGWDDIEPTIADIHRKLREGGSLKTDRLRRTVPNLLPSPSSSSAEIESHEGKRKTESLWPIMRLHHQRSRYIYDLYYKRHAISKELYDWCVKEKYADLNLIAKWRKPGYDNLCCLRCIQTRDTNFNTACICRVPQGKLEAGKVVQCQHCGCRGCG